MSFAPSPSVVVAVVAAAALAPAGCNAVAIDVAGTVPNSLRMGLVAHWSFDDTPGMTVADQTGHGHDGAVTNGSWIAGQFGGALHFDGTTEVQVPSFPQATRDWSVSLWVRPPDLDEGSEYVTLLSTEVAFSGGWQWNATLTPSHSLYQFAYFVGPGDSDYASLDCACVVTDAWTHLVAVVNNDLMTLYRNGVPSGTLPLTQPIRAGGPILYMGRWQMLTPPRVLIGDLDDIAIYERPLSAGEVQVLSRSAAPDPL